MDEEITQLPELYSNAVKIDVSIFDMVFTIGLRDPDSNEIRSLLRVNMSPQHAKAFFILFEKQMRAYEDAFGDIELPDELVASLLDKHSAEES
jgi:hypothetical protein